ncbi:MAG: hypothetical protein V4486_01555 [Patescibacteria group bacterium]
MSKRSVLDSPRLRELKRQRRNILWVKISVVVFGFCAIVGGLSLLTRIDKFNITQVEATGNRVVDTGEIRTIALENLEGNYLYIFPKTNFLLYPKVDIQKELEAKFPRLQNISFSIKNDRVLEISMTERDGLYTWCGDNPATNNDKNEKCYFMDNTGYIFDEAPYFSGNVYFKFYDGGLETGVGEYYEPAIFSNLITFKKDLDALGLKDIAITVTKDDEIKVVLSPKAPPAPNPQLILKKDADLSKIIENLQTALTTEPLQTDFKKNYGKLNYIDLRFGNKVYWKFNE